jgi:hypothetical protein
MEAQLRFVKPVIIFLFDDGLVSLYWLCGQVACTWDDVKSLRQDMERSLSSSAVHFRIKLLQAAAQMQVSAKCNFVCYSSEL